MLKKKLLLSAVAIIIICTCIITSAHAENTFYEPRCTAISSSDGDRIYIGYIFPAECSVNTLVFNTLLFNTIVFSPGNTPDNPQFLNGDIHVEILTSGEWQDTEAYFTPDSSTAGEYTINLNPTQAEGIRISGKSDIAPPPPQKLPQILRILCDIDSDIDTNITESPVQWLSPDATHPIATVKNPDISGGSRDIIVISDGYIPQAGEPFTKQYDTVSSENKNTPHEEFIGLMFDEKHEINTIRFTEGGNFIDGGWFRDGTLRLEVNIDYTWTPVEFESTPPYPDSNTRDDFFPDYETYTFTLPTPVTCQGIRLTGKAGGDANFISCAELSAGLTLPPEQPKPTQTPTPTPINPPSAEPPQNNINTIFTLTTFIGVLITIAFVIKLAHTSKNKVR